MNKRYYEHTLPIIRGSLSNTYNLYNIKSVVVENWQILRFTYFVL